MAVAQAMIHSTETQRLRLRTLSDADCTDWYVQSLNDPEVSCFMETIHTRHTHETVLDYVRTINARDNEFLFGMFLKDDGRHIGNIKVGPIHHYHRFGDVSLWIGKKFWGMGFATEAIKAISHYAFVELGAEKLSAGMYERNIGSYMAFIKAGYHHEGRMLAQQLLGGERENALLVGLSRDEKF